MELVDWAFTDLDDMKRFLGIDEDTDTDNDLLVTLINRASSFMENFTDRRLIATTYTAGVTTRENCYYDGDGSKRLFLKQYPVNSVSSVVCSGDTISAASATDYYGSTGYLLYNKRGELYYENGFDVGKQNVRVSYNAGYAVETREYLELQELCRSLVARVYNNRNHLGFKSETLFNYRYTVADLKDEAGGIGSLHQTLNRYRRKIIR